MLSASPFRILAYPRAGTVTLFACRIALRAAGLLLAAGAGVRYGMPKVLAEQGEWLRSAVAALAGGGCDDVVVVLGAAVVDVPAPARPVVAEDWQQGMGASLAAGLAAAGDADYAVVLTVDTPDVGADVVDRVLTAARAAPSGIARAVYGGRPGHPVVIAGRHWPALVADAARRRGRAPLPGRTLRCGDGRLRGSGDRTGHRLALAGA